MTELPWVLEARKDIGQREIKGVKHNPRITKYWIDGKTVNFKDDETPWCSGASCAWLERAKCVSPRSAWARSFRYWAQKLSGPAYGAIVVFSRGPTSGHVGIVVGRDRHGNLMVLGGNQSDAVNIKPFSRDRVLAYRWPKEHPLPKATGMATLPVLTSDGRVSTNEA